MKFLLSLVFLLINVQTFASSRCEGIDKTKYPDERARCEKMRETLATMPGDGLERTVIDCTVIDKIKHAKEREKCENIFIKTDKAVYVGKKNSLKRNADCEEVTERYSLCNGNRYIRDVAPYDSLGRSMKKIEEFYPGEISSSVIKK